MKKVIQWLDSKGYLPTETYERVLWLGTPVTVLLLTALMFLTGWV